MKSAEEEKVVPTFRSSTSTYFTKLMGVGSATARLDRWYVISLYADRIRNVARSVFGPAADHNGIRIRIEAPCNVVRVRQLW